jgi:hypothetical protein
MYMEDLVHAQKVQISCQECLCNLRDEAKSAGYNLEGLEGKVVLIPERWLEMPCPHGNVGLKFERVPVVSDEEDYEEVEFEAFGTFDTRMDATKNMGYPAREWPCTTQRYGSAPMYDPFNDESGPDGSGTY